MTEFLVFFTMKLSAKSDKQLEKTAIEVQDDLSKHLNIRVHAHVYLELTKKDSLKVD